MNTTNKNCPICSNNHFNSKLKLIDYSISKENFELIDCTQCGFRMTDPKPDESSLGKYYQSENYISHSDTNKGIINKIYHWVRNYSLIQKVNLINEYNKSTTKKLLDIGCGTGYFPEAAQTKGWNIEGIEPDDQARKKSEEKLNSKIHPNFLQADIQEKKDCITLWHVLEHVYDLKKTCDKINTLLDDKGTLVIAVPNYPCYDQVHYKNYWAGYDVPRHLYHFTKKDIQKLFEPYGFKVVKIKPMIFDAYYVAMLSEQYKSGGNIFKAFIIGFISNLKGIFNKEYSSHIYILKK